MKNGEDANYYEILSNEVLRGRYRGADATEHDEVGEIIEGRIEKNGK